MVLRAGQLVAPHLKLVRPLGKGGMGSVWVARHATLETEVAVKFIAHELSELDETIMARFKREAALSAKLKSPHVVKTFDHGTMLNGRPYIVMELLEGETLGERLAREKRLTTREVSLIVSQVAQVLKEAHDYTVVHRDIKPDNIFLLSSAYDLFAKVLDFGIAKQTSMPPIATVTDTGAIIGTPEYMSPEQLLSTGSADFRSDLWALAVLAYHALTGHAPFTGETLPALSLRICGGRFDPPSKHDAMLPRTLDLWFARAFAPKPADRFDDVSSMAESFRRVVAGDEDLGIAPTTPAPTAQRGAPTSSGRVSSQAGRGVDTQLPETELPDTQLASPGDKSSAWGPDESGPVQRISAGGIGDTLMSAADSGRAPTLRGPDDSGVHAAVAAASADQSGRRQALNDSLLSGRTPTFSGASSSLNHQPQQKRRGLLLLAAVATALLAVAGVANVELPDVGLAAPRAAATLQPLLPDLYDSHYRAAPASTASPVEASASSSASAEPVSPTTSASAAATVASAPSPRRRTQTWPRATAKPASPQPSSLPAPAPTNLCDNPYIANADGTLTVRPECLD